MPDELPAVTDPDASRLNAGLSDGQRLERRVRARVLVGVERVSGLGVSIGTTSSAKRPAACASAQRRWEVSANASCSLALTPQRSTTFSAVSPIEYG